LGTHIGIVSPSTPSTADNLIGQNRKVTLPLNTRFAIKSLELRLRQLRENLGNLRKRFNPRLEVPVRDTSVIKESLYVMQPRQE